MSIYVKSNHAKFHLDPIWNDEALLGFIEDVAPNKKKNKKKTKMSSDMKSVPDLKIRYHITQVAFLAMSDLKALASNILNEFRSEMVHVQCMSFTKLRF